MLPNKDELAILDEAIAAANADPAKARPAIVKAFVAGDLTLDQVDSWFVVQKEARPDLWSKDPAQAELDEATASLAQAAFVGRGSVDARGRLVKAVGEVAADRLARLHGIKGLTDFKTIGKAPTEGDGEPDDKGKDTVADKGKGKPSTNPWSPNYRGSNPAEAERVRIIKSLGTRAAASMATSAGTDLAGRPLRQRA